MKKVAGPSLDKKTTPPMLTRVLVVVFVFTQTAFGYKPSANLWEQRKENIQLASLPASFVQPSSFVSPSHLGSLGKLNKIESRPIATSQKTEYHPYLTTEFLRHVNVKSVYQGASKNTVVLIQDLHQNQEAQTNIANAIKSLGEGEGAESILVGLEGAYGAFHFDAYKQFPDQDIARQVADSFFESGDISGPAYVGFTYHQNEGKRSLTFRGVDDPIAYPKNVEAYKKSSERKPFVLDQIKKEQVSIHSQKMKIYSDELKEFDQMVEAYRKETLSLGAFLEKISRYEKELPLSAQIYLEAYRSEKELDFSQVEKERQQVLEKLVQTLDRAQINSLVQISLAYKQGDVSFGRYYQQLKALATANEIRLSDYPQFDAYVRYVLLTDGIKAEKLFNDSSALESDLFSLLATTEQERQLIARDQKNFLRSKLVEFGMTPQDWNLYKENEAPEAANIDLDVFEDFYRYAQARDTAMVRNLLKEPRQNLSVLVAGGFHAEGLTSLLKQKKVSYVVVAPKVTKIETKSGSHYLSVFDREKTPLEELFAGKKLFVVEPVAGAVKPLLSWTRDISKSMVVYVFALTSAIGPRSIWRFIAARRILGGHPKNVSVSKGKDEGALETRNINGEPVSISLNQKNLKGKGFLRTISRWATTPWGQAASVLMIFFIGAQKAWPNDSITSSDVLSNVLPQVVQEPNSLSVVFQNIMPFLMVLLVAGIFASKFRHAKYYKADLSLSEEYRTRRRQGRSRYAVWDVFEYLTESHKEGYISARAPWRLSERLPGPSVELVSEEPKIDRRKSSAIFHVMGKNEMAEEKIKVGTFRLEAIHDGVSIHFYPESTLKFDGDDVVVPLFEALVERIRLSQPGQGANPFIFDLDAEVLISRKFDSASAQGFWGWGTKSIVLAILSVGFSMLIISFFPDSLIIEFIAGGNPIGLNAETELVFGSLPASSQPPQAASVFLGDTAPLLFFGLTFKGRPISGDKLPITIADLIGQILEKYNKETEKREKRLQEIRDAKTDDEEGVEEKRLTLELKRLYRFRKRLNSLGQPEAYGKYAINLLILSAIFNNRDIPEDLSVLFDPDLLKKIEKNRRDVRRIHEKILKDAAEARLTYLKQKLTNQFKKEQEGGLEREFNLHNVSLQRIESEMIKELRTFKKATRDLELQPYLWDLILKKLPSTFDLPESLFQDEGEMVAIRTSVVQLQNIVETAANPDPDSLDILLDSADHIIQGFLRIQNRLDNISDQSDELESYTREFDLSPTGNDFDLPKTLVEVPASGLLAENPKKAFGLFKTIKNEKTSYIAVLIPPLFERVKQHLVQTIPGESHEDLIPDQVTIIEDSGRTVDGYDGISINLVKDKRLLANIILYIKKSEEPIFVLASQVNAVDPILVNRMKDFVVDVLKAGEFPEPPEQQADGSQGINLTSVLWWVVGLGSLGALVAVLIMVGVPVLGEPSFEAMRASALVVNQTQIQTAGPSYISQFFLMLFLVRAAFGSEWNGGRTGAREIVSLRIKGKFKTKHPKALQKIKQGISRGGTEKIINMLKAKLPDNLHAELIPSSVELREQETLKINFIDSQRRTIAMFQIKIVPNKHGGRVVVLSEHVPNAMLNRVMAQYFENLIVSTGVVEESRFKKGRGGVELNSGIFITLPFALIIMGLITPLAFIGLSLLLTLVFFAARSQTFRNLLGSVLASPAKAVQILKGAIENPPALKLAYRTRKLRDRALLKPARATLVAALLAVGASGPVLASVNKNEIQNGQPLVSAIQNRDPYQKTELQLRQDVFLQNYLESIVNHPEQTIDDVLTRLESKEEASHTRTTLFNLGELNNPRLTENRINDLETTLIRANHDREAGVQHNVVINLFEFLDQEQVNKIHDLANQFPRRVIVLDMKAHQANIIGKDGRYLIDELNKVALLEAAKVDNADFEALKKIVAMTASDPELRLNTQIPTSFRSGQQLKDYLVILTNMGHGYKVYGPGALELMIKAASLLDLMA